MEQKKVVVIEGEDASPEAVRPTLALIDKLNLRIEWLHPAVGDEGVKRHGSVFPDEARRAIDDADATFFGATSGQTDPRQQCDTQKLPTTFGFPQAREFYTG